MHSIDYDKQECCCAPFPPRFLLCILLKCIWCGYWQFEEEVKAADVRWSLSPVTLLLLSHIDPCPLCVYVSDLLSAGPASSVQLLLLLLHTLYCRSHILTTPVSYFIPSIWLQNNVLTPGLLMLHGVHQQGVHLQLLSHSYYSSQVLICCLHCTYLFTM